MMNKESLLKGCLLGILGFAAQWVTAQTFDNETVTAIWGMSGGANEPSQAVVSNEHAFSTTAFVLGKEMTFTKQQEYKGADENLSMNNYKPSAQMNAATDGHDLVYSIKPAKGLMYQPGSISFKMGVFGTGGGMIDIYLKYADGMKKTVASNVKPNRSGASVNATECTYELTGMPATDEEVSLIISVYNLANNKEIGFNNVVMTGTVNGTAVEVPQYSITTALQPENAGTVNQLPAGDLMDEGTNVTVTASPKFGFHFINWVDNAGKEVSAENPYSFSLKANTSLKAVFQEVNTYTFTTRCINDLEMQIGSISLNPESTEGKYEEGTVVTVVANELPIARFLNWEDEFENSNVTKPERTVTVKQNTEIVANYEIQDFIAAYNSDKAEIWANKGTYPFAADYVWDSERNATASVVKISDGNSLDGNSSGTPVVRMRKGAVISSVNGLYMNGYRSTDVAMQVQFSTKKFTTVRFTAALVAKNAANVNWRVLYSTDGTVYNPVINNGEELVYKLSNGLATSVDFESPAEEVAEKEMVYIRFTGTGDELLNDNNGEYNFDKVDSGSGLNYTDHSETGLGNIYVFGTPIIDEDPDAPVIKAIIPADKATGVSANGKITISYDERIQAGTGEATLTGNGKTIVLEPEYGSSSVSFRYANLAYATQYTLELPEGYVTDRSDNRAPAVNTTFTVMERVKPEARLFNAIVDQSLDASIAPTSTTIGQYKTIQEAIDAVPVTNNKPWLIFIKAGYYNDLNNRTFSTGKYTWEDQSGKLPASEDSRIVVVDRPFIHLIGEDVNKVTIAQDRVAGSNSADKSQPWYNVAEGATLVIKSNDFYAENLTIDNEWWTKYEGNEARGPQALSLYVEADRVAFNNCRIRSYQDTYLSPKTGNTNTGNNQPHYYDRNYFRNTMIEGAVDFIYGGGDVYFDNCTLNIVRESGGYIVAPSHYTDMKDSQGNVTQACTRWGYVFKNTTITAPDGKEDKTQVYFGRPWHNEPKTVFIDTECRVKPYEGYWYPKMGAIPALWAVYNIWDKNGYKMSEKSIEEYWYEENGQTIYGKAKNFLTDEEAASYTLENVFGGDGTDAVTGMWNPLPMVEQTSKPVINGKEGDTAFGWTADEYAICYVVTINGKVAGFTVDTRYEANLNDVVTVQSVNEYGALSEASDEFTVGNTGTGLENTAMESPVIVIGSKGTISVRGIEIPTRIYVYGIDGTLIQNLEVHRNVSLSVPAGRYIVKANDSVTKVSVN